MGMSVYVYGAREDVPDMFHSKSVFNISNIHSIVTACRRKSVIYLGYICEINSLKIHQRRKA